MPDIKEVILQKCKNAIDSGEPIMDYSFYYRVMELLKEQEAVKPTWGRGMPFCGACGLRIRGRKFCSECGKPIAWEGR